MEARRRWIVAFVQELFTMPRRHRLVFLLATVTLVVVQVEVIEGWRLVHLVELLGIMLVLYMGWATWRVARMLKR